MRLIVTADIHYNQPKSRILAQPLIDQINAQHPDALLLVGDTAGSEGHWLETCLSAFNCAGPKLLVAGNHELWTAGSDSHRLFHEELPRRIANAGWHWLEANPIRLGNLGIAGTVGWYDYSFARPELGIPRRFYAAKVSPGAAERFSEFAALFHTPDDIPPAARELYARWNDGRFVKLGRSDETFLDELLATLERSLESLADCERVLVASHHVPFEQLLPPAAHPRWDFARAFLGSPRIGQLIERFPNVTHAVCGHSHFPVETQIGQITAINIGSGYRNKTHRIFDFQ